MTRVLTDANVLTSAALARNPQAPSVLVPDAALDGRIELSQLTPRCSPRWAQLLGRRLRPYLSLAEAQRAIGALTRRAVIAVRRGCGTKAALESRRVLAEVGARAAMPNYVAMDRAGETNE